MTKTFGYILSSNIVRDTDYQLYLCSPKMKTPMEDIRNYLYNLISDRGISDENSDLLTSFFLLLIFLMLVFIAYFITKRVLVKAFKTLATASRTEFDDMLIENKVPHFVANLVPLFLSIHYIPMIFKDYPTFENPLEVILKIYGIILIIWIFRSILRSLESYFKTIPSLMDKPIDSYIQVVMLFIWIVGIAAGFVILTGISFWMFFTSLGAASAVLLLIFKDTILGLVASIQVAVNDTVRIGDWITMQKYGADGDVTEINLNTVQVQNFDKTITIIPTSALLTDAFTNWRGMSNSGGRRIKRAILIKPSSITYLDNEHIEKLKKIELISNYLDQRQSDIDAHNRKEGTDKSTLINGRNMTNFGVFRKYLQTYIEKHPGINKDMTVMTRQLAPTPHGIPLELYAFSKDKKWENYEFVMADIFDHCIAAIPYFELEIFEYNMQLPKPGA